METLLSTDNSTLKIRWAEWDKASNKTGQGYNCSPELDQKFVDFLGDLPVFETPTEASLGNTKTETYGELYGKNPEGQSSAHMPRRKELYQSRSEERRVGKECRS